jgi:hypothetical protein
MVDQRQVDQTAAFYEFLRKPDLPLGPKRPFCALDPQER